MLLRDHYYSANKWRIVEIKKFSIGAGTTKVLVPKRLCLVVSSRSVRRQPEKLGRQWWKVWNKVLPGDWCRQSGVLVDQVCQRHEWVVPGIAARYREELCSSVLQSYTVCAPEPAASEGWRVHLWCGRNVSEAIISTNSQNSKTSSTVWLTHECAHTHTSIVMDSMQCCPWRESQITVSPTSENIFTHKINP